MKHSFDDEIVKICNDLPINRVIVAGLDMDFKGNLWTHAALMATAEYVTKVHCLYHRKSCHYSFRKTDNDKLVVWRNRRIRAIKSSYYHAMRKDAEKKNSPTSSKERS
jgi:thymidine kinase